MFPALGLAGFITELVLGEPVTRKYCREQMLPRTTHMGAILSIESFFVRFRTKSSDCEDA